MTMDLRDLEAFVEVADRGSVSAAAQRLHLTQPAVSKRLKSLEDRLGSALFDRVARRVLLTDAGRALLPYARKALHEVEDGRRAVSNLAGTVAGRLSIGTSHHIGLHRLPPVLRAYTARHPEVDLDIHFMDSEIACEQVLAGKLELGIVTLPTQIIENLETRLVWPDPLAVVTAPSHPLAGKRRVTLADLAHHPAVMPDEQTYTHRIVQRALEMHGLSPRIRLATNYLETLKMLVTIGLGWSVLPVSMLDDTLQVVKIPELDMRRDLGVVRHRRRTLSAGGEAMLRALVGG